MLNNNKLMIVYDCIIPHIQFNSDLNDAVICNNLNLILYFSRALPIVLSRDILNGILMYDTQSKNVCRLWFWQNSHIAVLYSSIFYSRDDEEWMPKFNVANQTNSNHWMFPIFHYQDGIGFFEELTNTIVRIESQKLVVPLM